VVSLRSRFCSRFCCTDRLVALALAALVAVTILKLPLTRGFATARDFVALHRPLSPKPWLFCGALWFGFTPPDGALRSCARPRRAASRQRSIDLTS